MYADHGHCRRCSPVAPGHFVVSVQGASTAGSKASWVRESIDDAPRPFSLVLSAPLPNGSLAGLEHAMHECYTLTAPSGAATPELVLLVPRARGVQVLDGAAPHHTLSFWTWDVLTGVRGELQSDDPDDMEIAIVQIAELGDYTFETDDAGAIVEDVNARRNTSHVMQTKLLV